MGADDRGSGLTVFISHASEDKHAIVKTGIIQTLMGEGLGVFIDQPSELIDLPKWYRTRLQGIPVGVNWNEYVVAEVHRADCVLAFWSSNFNRKLEEASSGGLLQDEVSIAHRENKLIYYCLEKDHGPSKSWQHLTRVQHAMPFDHIRTQDQASEVAVAIHDKVRELQQANLKHKRGPRQASLEERLQRLLVMLDRSNQEYGFVQSAKPESRPEGIREPWSSFPTPVSIVSGPALEHSLRFPDRLASVTFPGCVEFYSRAEHTAWDDVVEAYVNEQCMYEPWERYQVVWPDTGHGQTFDQALDDLTFHIQSKLRCDHAAPGFAEIVRCLSRPIPTGGKDKGRLFVSELKESQINTTDLGLIERLAQELHNVPARWFQYLIIVQERRGPIFPFLWGGGPSAAGRLRCGATSCLDPDLRGERPLWFKFPRLAPIKRDDLNPWIRWAAKATNVPEARIAEHVDEMFSEPRSLFSLATWRGESRPLPYRTVEKKMAGLWQRLAKPSTGEHGGMSGL